MVNSDDSLTPALWRKEVEDWLGFALRIPEYARVTYAADKGLYPDWPYRYLFYGSDDRTLCLLKHNTDALACGEETGRIPGIPETFGSDEDWRTLFGAGAVPPPFKGFPWSFTLMYFDEQGRPGTEITAWRTFREDSSPAVHMTWYLVRWAYDHSGEPRRTDGWGRFDWELP